jgi:hypothetical protein
MLLQFDWRLWELKAAKAGLSTRAVLNAFVGGQYTKALQRIWYAVLGGVRFFEEGTDDAVFPLAALEAWPGSGIGLVTTAANYTALIDDEMIGVGTAGGARTITLPNPTTCAGKTYTIKRASGGNAVNVATTGGAVEVASLTAVGQTRTYYSDGTNWVVIAGFL